MFVGLCLILSAPKLRIPPADAKVKGELIGTRGWAQFWFPAYGNHKIDYRVLARLGLGQRIDLATKPKLPGRSGWKTTGRAVIESIYHDHVESWNIAEYSSLLEEVHGVSNGKIIYAEMVEGVIRKKGKTI